MHGLFVLLLLLLFIYVYAYLNHILLKIEFKHIAMHNG